jgi:hypothetical protein
LGLEDAEKQKGETFYVTDNVELIVWLMLVKEGYSEGKIIST